MTVNRAPKMATFDTITILSVLFTRILAIEASRELTFTVYSLNPQRELPRHLCSFRDHLNLYSGNLVHE